MSNSSQERLVKKVKLETLPSVQKSESPQHTLLPTISVQGNQSSLNTMHSMQPLSSFLMDTTPISSVSQSNSFSFTPLPQAKKNSRTATQMQESPQLRLDTSDSLSQSKKTIPKRPKNKWATEPTKFSSRVQKLKEEKLSKLTGLSSSLGKISDRHSKNDVTPFFMLPLDPGNDNRGYTSTDARTKILEKVKSSKVSGDSLEALGLPEFVLDFHKSVEETGKGMLKSSTRSQKDGFKQGFDLTYTANLELPHEKRVSSDTPWPSSPNPYTEKAQLTEDVRYERTHQGAFRFSGESGGTVHAPTQGNQVVDTKMERFIAKQKGGFIVRMDTYEASSLWAVRPTETGFKSIQASYMRRSVPEEKKE